VHGAYIEIDTGRNAAETWGKGKLNPRYQRNCVRGVGVLEPPNSVTRSGGVKLGRLQVALKRETLW
jgi:hypothetical protein